MQQLAVCTAGTLLEVILSEDSCPIGKVSILYLHPFSFCEFLIAVSVSGSFAGAYGNASSYAAKELLLVRNYLDVREAKINNNLIDNALRPFCLGKKNWLFAQTEDGVRRALLSTVSL
jgi:hypothetical protein